MRIVPSHTLALALAALAALGACGGGDREAAPAGETARTVRDASWDEFLAARPPGGGRRQVVVIGLDAAPWSYVDQLVAEGRMPNMARVLREGVRATLRSVDTYVTPPAWTAMFTGYAPERTGVYTFGYWNRETTGFRGANAADVAVPFVWEAASRAGLEVAVANVPMTYPVRDVNGIMVAGMMTPVDMVSPPNISALRVPAALFRDAPGAPDYSPPIRGAAGDSLNGFLWRFHDTTDDNRRNYDTVALRVLSHDASGETSELAFNVLRTGSYTPWIPVRMDIEGRIVNAWTHAFLDISEDLEFTFRLTKTVLPIEVPFTHPAELAAELDKRFGFYMPSKHLDTGLMPQMTQEMSRAARFFYDYGDWDLYAFVFTETDKIHHYAGFGELAAEVYAICDSLIGDIMARMPENAVLVVSSDHGSRHYEMGVDLNRVFEEMGLLAFDHNHHIDFTRTLVFHNLYALWFNRKVITRQAVTARGIHLAAGADPVQTLMDTVQRALADLRASDGTPYPIEVNRVPADAVGQHPDMIVRGTYDGYAVIFWNLNKPKAEAFNPLEDLDGMWHQRDGILALWGGPVRHGVDIGMREIEDVAPTILYLLGLPVAPDMKGRLIADAFDPHFTRDHPLHVNDGYLDLPRAAMARDRKDQESLEKQLRSLGYVR